MKKLTYYVLSALAILFSACDEPAVTFSEPQPVNEKNLSRIPKKLQGLYLNLEDTSITLNISENTICKIYDADLKELKSELDSNLQLNGN